MQNPETDNELLARFLNWKIEGEFIWVPNSFPDNEPAGETQFRKDDPFFGRYDFLVPVWNRAVAELWGMFPDNELPDNIPDMYYPMCQRCYYDDPSFEISTRLPILKEIITFLDKLK
jgi:hypothetical protein